MKLPLQFIKELLSATDAVNFYKKEDDGWNREYHFKAEQVLEALKMETTWTPETNRIPFGLLTKEEQAALKACKHGWVAFNVYGQWVDNIYPTWEPNLVYRAKPAPKRLVSWLHWCNQHGLQKTNEESYAIWMLRSRGGWLKRIEINEDGSDPQIFVEEV